MTSDLIRPDIVEWVRMLDTLIYLRVLSSTRRTAVCEPACTVVWEGKTGDCPPYPD